MKKADIKPVKEMPKSVELPEYVAARGIEPTCYEAKEGDSVLISRSVRSGQCLHIVGNAIIMGDVNAGAQVMATGNIVIMGKLKGLVHAGTYGDREAYIVAWQMDPIQIRIADVLSRSEDNSKLDIQYPEIAKIENGQIIIQPYRFSKSIYQKKVVIA